MFIASISEYNSKLRRSGMKPNNNPKPNSPDMSLLRSLFRSDIIGYKHGAPIGAFSWLLSELFPCPPLIASSLAGYT